MAPEHQWNCRSGLVCLIVKRAKGRQLSSDMLEEILSDIDRLDRDRYVSASEAHYAIHFTSDNQWKRLLRDANSQIGDA